LTGRSKLGKALHGRICEEDESSRPQKKRRNEKKRQWLQKRTASKPLTVQQTANEGKRKGDTEKKPKNRLRGRHSVRKKSSNSRKNHQN